MKKHHYVRILCAATSLMAAMSLVAETKQEIIYALQQTERSFKAIDPKHDLFQKSRTSGMWSTDLYNVTQFTKKHAFRDKILVNAERTITSDFEKAVQKVRDGYQVLTRRPFVQQRADAIAKELKAINTNMQKTYETLEKAEFVLRGKKETREVLMAAARFVQSFADNAFRQLANREFHISQDDLPGNQT